MNCVNCGALLAEADLEYCPNCGCNVMIQKKVDYLSKSLYNQGLEKASIRDLSGAIACLKQSLVYDKRNIQARNLLGLVYFETGEVVSALSEWVISKNLQPLRNLATDYINKLQANPNKLSAINETIRKYNHALMLCREGHEDMAAVQLRRILAQNSKLIKGYHLLALIQIKNHDWNRARRTLKKAARIDKTNTTTLRFLREVDEQTGVTTKLERETKKGLFGFSKNHKQVSEDEDGIVQAPVYKEHSHISMFVVLAAGIAAGAAAFWLLAVPQIRQGIYKEANQQIVQYSESLASQGAELSKVQGEAESSSNTVDELTQQLSTEQTKTSNYEALLNAYYYVQQQSLDEAAVQIQNVQVDALTDSQKTIYNIVKKATGVSGVGDTASADDSSSDTSSEADSSEGSYDDSSYDDSSYDDSSYDDSSYDDSSYDDSSYDDSSYDDSYYDESSYDDYYE